MQVPQSALDRFLALYKWEARYLKSADVDFPSAVGNFAVHSSTYAQDTGHLTAVDLLICYNQLAFVLGWQAYLDRRLPGLENIAMENDFQERSFIVGMDNIRFRKVIDPPSFQGSVEIEKVKKMQGLYVLQTSYDFGQGSATGNIGLAISLS